MLDAMWRKPMWTKVAVRRAVPVVVVDDERGVVGAVMHELGRRWGRGGRRRGRSSRGRRRC